MSRSATTLGWVSASTRTGHVKAVGTGPHSGQVLYGEAAERALHAEGRPVDGGDADDGPGGTDRETFTASLEALSRLFRGEEVATSGRSLPGPPACRSRRCKRPPGCSPTDFTGPSRTGAPLHFSNDGTKSIRSALGLSFADAGNRIGSGAPVKLSGGFDNVYRFCHATENTGTPKFRTGP